MKVLATLLLSLTIPGSHVGAPSPSPVDRPHKQQQARRGGRWYLAENGHAVYCYGPVRVVTQAQGGLQRVATFCLDNQPMVPLKD
jgi:hypothetical protein